MILYAIVGSALVAVAADIGCRLAVRRDKPGIATALTCVYLAAGCLVFFFLVAGVMLELGRP